MSFKTICAFLAGEPYHLTIPEIMQLTPYQVETIYLHPRDKDGQLVDDRPQQDMRTLFFSIWRKRGLEQHQIEQKWQEYVAEQQKRMK